MVVDSSVPSFELSSTYSQSCGPHAPPAPLNEAAPRAINDAGNAPDK
jgi:hypothetical protein